MKPTLKAPITQRLNLYIAKVLSNVAFNFNLRRYILGAWALSLAAHGVFTLAAYHNYPGGVALARRCRLTLSNPL